MDIQLTDLTQALQAQVKVPILCYDLKLMYICEGLSKEDGGEETNANRGVRPSRRKL